MSSDYKKLLVNKTSFLMIMNDLCKKANRKMRVLPGATTR